MACPILIARPDSPATFSYAPMVGIAIERREGGPLLTKTKFIGSLNNSKADIVIKFG
jgi:hypothetical protein